MEKKIALVISIVLAILAGLMVKSYIEKEKAKVTKGLGLVKVVVASRNIEAGEALNDSNIASRSYPVKYVGDRSIYVDDLYMINGQKLKNSVQEGKPVLWSDIEMQKKEGFASTIKPGMRAITIPVSELSSISHMVEPGSRIDLLLTFDQSVIAKPEKDKGAVSNSEKIPDVKDVQAFREYLVQKYGKQTESAGSMTVMLKQNVLVLSTGRNFLGQYQGGNEKADSGYSTVTIMLSPVAAQEVLHALSMGEIKIMLRSDADVNLELVAPSTSETVWRSSVASAISQSTPEE